MLQNIKRELSSEALYYFPDKLDNDILNVIRAPVWTCPTNDNNEFGAFKAWIVDYKELLAYKGIEEPERIISVTNEQILRMNPEWNEDDQCIF